MRFIQAWSYTLARNLALQLNESHEKRRVYYFSLQVVIGEFVKIALLLLIALVFGFFIPTVICIAVFIVMRTAAGGYHMETQGKCFFASLGMFVVPSILVQHTYIFWENFWTIMFIIMAFVTSLGVFIKWAPADTPNKPIDNPKEIRRLKRNSVVYAIIWLAVIAFLAVNHLVMYCLAMSFGLLLEAFTVAPAGYRFFDWISGKGS